MPKIGLMLVNLGTPNTTNTSDVRRYLREFLSDPRVVDIAPMRRWLLLNLFILPFRPKVSAAAYRLVWTDRGSPLLVHGQDLAAKMAIELGDDVHIELAMRYQNPSIAVALERFRAAGTDRIVVFPLFPQYSSAAWGSAVEKVCVEANRLWNVPSLNIVPTFHDHPAFIDALVAVARPTLADFKPDRIVMSFHGLPERHVVKSDESAGRHCLQSETCCETTVPANRYCYRAQCFATARALAHRLDLAPDDYDISFQSRLGRSPWIKPYTDLLIRELASKGVRRVAVLSPAFVADCLETIEEIGIRARKDFVANGGEDLCLVPSLNSEDAWVKAAVQLVQEAEPSISTDATERSVTPCMTG